MSLFSLTDENLKELLPIAKKNANTANHFVTSLGDILFKAVPFEKITIAVLNICLWPSLPLLIENTDIKNKGRLGILKAGSAGPAYDANKRWLNRTFVGVYGSDCAVVQLPSITIANNSVRTRLPRLAFLNSKARQQRRRGRQQHTSRP
jgi:hypothetical protein